MMRGLKSEVEVAGQDMAVIAPIAVGVERLPDDEGTEGSRG
jgi:hypothetical protein